MYRSFLIALDELLFRLSSETVGVIFVFSSTNSAINSGHAYSCDIEVLDEKFQDT